MARLLNILLLISACFPSITAAEICSNNGKQYVQLFENGGGVIRSALQGACNAQGCTATTALKNKFNTVKSKTLAACNDVTLSQRQILAAVTDAVKVLLEDPAVPQELKSLTRRTTLSSFGTFQDLLDCTVGESCRSGDLSFGDSCYHFSTEKAMFYRGDEKCRNEYRGFLVSIMSEAEQEFLNAKTAGNAYWIGVVRPTITLKPRWMDTMMFAVYTNWKPFYPRCIPGDFNGVLVEPSSGQWIDGYYTELHNYVCKYKTSPPEITTTAAPTTISITAPIAGCHEGDKAFGDHCYYFSPAENYQDGATFWCVVLRNASIVSIMSASEQDFLNRETAGKSYWIGLHQPTDDISRWMDNGVPAVYTNWKYGYPRDSAPGFEIVVAEPPSGQWRNEYYNGLHNYVCKYKNSLV